jgi:anti-sigma B factor antagonist
MEIKTIEKDGTVILFIDGRVDASTAGALENELNRLIATGKINLLLDFEKVNYISSGGLRVLLGKEKELSKKKEGLKLCHLNPDVYKVFKISGFTSIFKIYPSEKEALSQN